MLPGVYFARKKSGENYYRASVTIGNKHISLGSFGDENRAHAAYKTAIALSKDREKNIEDYPGDCPLSFKKWVVLINYRDNGMYIKTPIYLKEKFFYYYFAPEDYLIFDSDEMFYYSNHSIMRRGGHLFVADFGMQVNILNRYGIKNFAVAGRDYIFINGNNTDFRSANIRIINSYQGVREFTDKNKTLYETKIHIRGDVLVGRYPDEVSAAVAYNKAVDILRVKGIEKNYVKNYIVELETDEYLNIYKNVKISRGIIRYQ